MEEKVLIRSKRYNVIKCALIIAIIIGVVVSTAWFNRLASQYKVYYEEVFEDYVTHQRDGDCGWGYDEGQKCYDCKDFSKHPNKIEFVFYHLLDVDGHYFVTIPIGVSILLGLLIYFWLSSYELTVTDKRIYGKLAWGRRIDLPVDSVSAIALTRILGGVTVATSSGRISFLAIKNAEEIYKMLNNLIIDRQQNAVRVVNKAENEDIESIRKYKELLDNGVITQKEFDQKKKQILGL